MSENTKRFYTAVIYGAAFYMGCMSGKMWLLLIEVWT